MRVDERRMVGDPSVPWDRRAKQLAKGDRDANTAACLYGAAMMRKAGRLPTEMSNIDVLFRPPGTLIFVSADEKQIEVGRYVIPQRVLTYKPKAIALPPQDARSA